MMEPAAAAEDTKAAAVAEIVREIARKPNAIPRIEITINEETVNTVKRTGPLFD